MESSSEPSKEIMSGDDYGPKVGPTEIPARPRSLSKMERLLLRKQALKVKKRPVLAIGIISSLVYSAVMCHIGYKCLANLTIPMLD